MKTISKYLVMVAIVFFAACSNEKEATQVKPSQEGKLSEENVFKGYEDALDKAAGVEQTIQDAAQKQREELEKQEY